MTEIWVDLNGYGNQQAYGNVYRQGQSGDGNYSSFHAVFRYLANGYGSWGATCNWSVSGPWGTRANSFFIGSNDTARYNTITFDEFDFNVGHDGEGNMGGFNWSLGFSADHSGIGGGNGGGTEGAAPRIPKRPGPPNTPTISGVKPRSFHVSFQYQGDQRGSAVDKYQIQVCSAADMNSGQIAAPEVTGGEWDSGDIASPGVTYYARVRAHNGASYDNGGWSDWTSIVSFKTASGAYYDAADNINAYNPVEVLVGKDGVFVSADILVGKGGSYVNAG